MKCLRPYRTARTLMQELVGTSPFHTSATLHASAHKSSRHITAPSSRTRLAKDLKPRSRGKLDVAPRPKADHSNPSRPKFTRDSVPHEGVSPRERGPIRRRISAEAHGTSSRKLESEAPLDLKHWAARAHSERTDKRAAVARRYQNVENPLQGEFDLSTESESSRQLPKNFTSPPLLDGLLASLRESLPADARPTPIQALSLKHLFKERDSAEPWRQFLLASETGSGKSIAYLLPMLQDLKKSELRDPSPTSDPPGPQRAINPRGIILSPTHELSRQLSSFAKRLLHNIKLRVLCASRANMPSAPIRNRTASKMAGDFSGPMGPGEFEILKGGKSRPVDILVGTPMKVLEMARGRGWNWEERDRKRRLAEDPKALEETDPETDKVAPARRYWVDEPEMSLAGIEWVVVDEADVLFDPDFQQSTRMLLADIAAARGHPVSFIPDTPLLPASPEAPQTAAFNYPFNLVLTSATIPSSLASYLDTYHPTLTRLASPNLHHLPRTIKTEYAGWTGGNRNADIERRVRRVWAEDALACAKMGLPVDLSKVLVFCNRRSKVEDLSAYLTEKGIKNVALTGTADGRKRGSNHHLNGFLRAKTTVPSSSTSLPSSEADVPPPPANPSADPKENPHVMITTSLLSRGLDFSPDIRHVFIVDEPRNMIDFLHRAGRSGRAGQEGKVVVFGRTKGRGSGRTEAVKKRVGALVA
ncbi:P-loop containing nucleoside triphosphate hydrolase protein [Leucogyrophana mollusca]|uniref:P-loop containing nucleoside triphosphate hydrolase protein n=1 Tax=Leucogyrophana mollusca TaxID=85980 RepID=A0ACB8BDT0_9AGAM|nr:P-loop containing nucleoside triphosphate hydrolase protein [Leucogyrophana mollusca]